MNSVDSYLSNLTAERRAELQVVRAVVNANLPQGYVEGIDFGMISWSVPLSTYPNTYNGHPLSIAALAAQKKHNALYLVGVYGVDDGALRSWFESAWQKSGKRLDMGKSCVRFQSARDLALDVVGQTIARVSVADFLAHYERTRAPRRDGAKTEAAASERKPAAKKVATTKARKPAAKNVAAKPASDPK
jgi:hypothetical protein